MEIKYKDITIHPISSNQHISIIYWYKGKLWRSPMPDYKITLAKAVKLPYVQSTVMTEHILIRDGKRLPVYEHIHYPHRTRIQELPMPRAKDIILALCEINIEATKVGIICKEIHEANINDTLDGIIYLDMSGFRDANIPETQHSFTRVSAFTKQYLNSKDPATLKALDYRKSKSWVKLRDLITKIKTKKLDSSGWFTGYSHEMDIYKPINKKAEIVWEMLNSIDDYDTVTDVASNKGYYTLLAARKCKSAIGFEIDESCVDFATNLNRSEHQLPAIFSCATLQSLMSDELYEHDRYASDLIMALAIVHHLNKIVSPTGPKRFNKITHQLFAKMLMKYSKKYILIENIGNDRGLYEAIFTKNNYELVDRQHNGPNKRHISLYRKLK